MRPPGIATAGLMLALALTACSKPSPSTNSGGGVGGILGGGDKLPSDALDDAVAKAIGDPATCLLIARASDHKVLYRYGDGFNCVRGLPACDRPGALSAEGALALATPAGRTKSCDSTASGDRTVAWAEGKVKSTHQRDLVYSAMMEGQRALPGIEMAARLDEAFADVGL